MQQPPGYPPGPPGYPPSGGPPPGGGYGPPGGGYPPPPGGGYPPPPFGGGPPGAPPPMGGGPQFPYGSPPGGPMGGGAPPPKKGMSGAQIALIVIAVLAVTGFGGCGLCLCVFKSSADSAKEQEDLDRRRARNVSASELLTSYRTNEVRADSQFKGKWVTVQGGQVDEVRSSYLLVGTGKYLEIPEVQCILKSDQLSRASSLGKGRRVTVRGKVSGMLINVMLNECEIL